PEIHGVHETEVDFAGVQERQHRAGSRVGLHDHLVPGMGRDDLGKPTRHRVVGRARRIRGQRHLFRELRVSGRCREQPDQDRQDDHELGGPGPLPPRPPALALRVTISIFERPELRGLAGEAELSPACRDILVHGPTDLRPLRELLDVAVLHAGVDQRLGAVGPLVGRVLRRVEPGRPGVAQDVDILDGVAARGHRPDDLIHVRGIDVLVHGDDPLRVVRASRTLGGQRQRLSRVAGVALLERDHRHAPAARRGGMRVDPADAGDAEPIEIVPDPRRPRDGEQCRVLVRRVVGHERVSEDRVVAIVNGLHVDEERQVLGTAVVPGELAERSLELLRIRRDGAFGHDLRARRVDEARDLALHQLHGTSHQPASEIQLRDGLGEGLTGDDEERGIDAPAHHDLARLAAAPAPLDVEPRVLARGEIEANLILGLDHLAIRSDVEPSAVGIARDDRIAGPDVLAAVSRPVARRGEVANVDLVVAQVVLVGGLAEAVHDHGWNRERELALAPPHQLHDAEAGRLTDGHREAVNARADRIPEGAIPRRRLLDLLEEQRGGVDLLVRHVGDRTHLLVAADLFADARELADPLDSVDPRAQVPRCLPAARSLRAERSDVEAHLFHRHPPGSPLVNGHGRGHVRCSREAFYMKRLLALALGITVMVGVAAGPASAGQFVSVFPIPRDPWASWGHPHRHTTVVVPAPGSVAVTPGVVGTPVYQPVWYPGQWAWSGYGWVWVPGHWAY